MDPVQNDTDPTNFNQPVIGAIKEVLRGQLTSIAYKLLSSEHSKLEDLLWRSKTCGNLSTTATFTSSSLGSLTPFQNFNSTGLYLASSQFICLLEWSSLHTMTSNHLQIKTNLQLNLCKSLLNLHSLLNL